jgi:hypothetical protein
MHLHAPLFQHEEERNAECYAPAALAPEKESPVEVKRKLGGPRVELDVFKNRKIS